MSPSNDEPSLEAEITEASREVERTRRLAHRDRQFVPDLIDSLCELAKYRSRQGEDQRAERLFREALTHCAESPAEISPELLFRIQSLMAYHYDHRGEGENALLHYERALALAEKCELLEPVQIAVVHNNIAMLDKKLERPEDSEKHYNLAIENFERAEDAESDPRLGSVYNNLGVLHYSLLQFEKSREFHDRALAIRTLIFGEEGHHYDLGQSYNNLAAVYKAMGDYQTASDYFAKVDALADGIASMNSEANRKEDAEASSLNLDEAI